MIIRQTRSTQRKGRSCCVDWDAWARYGSADICTEKQANHVTGEKTYAALIRMRGALQKRGCTTEISRLTHLPFCGLVNFTCVFFFGANPEAHDLFVGSRFLLPDSESDPLW